MTEKQGCQIQRLRVRIHFFIQILCLLFSFYTNLSHVKINQPKIIERKRQNNGDRVMFGVRLEGLSVLECASWEDAWMLFGVICQQQWLVTLSHIYNSETSGRWSCNLICQITWISAFLDIWLISRFLCYYSWKVFLIVKSSIVYEIIPCKQKICSFKLCQKYFGMVLFLEYLIVGKCLQFSLMNFYVF